MYDSKKAVMKKRAVEIFNRLFQRVELDGGARKRTIGIIYNILVKEEPMLEGTWGSTDCPNCGEEMFVLHGLTFDRDGIRDARYCCWCHSLYACHARGFSLVKQEHIVKDSDVIYQLKRTIAQLQSILPPEPPQEQSNEKSSENTN